MWPSIVKNSRASRVAVDLTTINHNGDGSVVNHAKRPPGMSKRSYLIVTVVIVLVSAPFAAFFGSMALIERQRVADAERAFLPILHLEPIILSQPVAFYRHCRYVVEFPSGCKLTDDNIGQLESLNLLPERNTLDVTIHTKNVTDASVTRLSSIKTFDLIAVDDTAITDKGIEKLREALPHAIIPTRTSN